MKPLLCIIILTACVLKAQPVQPVRIELPSDRSVTAFYETNTPIAESCRLSVSFIPVTTLDEVTNAEMTETLAQFYAEEILSLQLTKEVGIDFSVATWSMQKENQMVSFSFTIPKKAIYDAIQKEKTHPALKELLDDQRDASTRIQEFRSLCFRDIRTAEAIYSDMIRASKENVEKNIQSSLSDLQNRISNDNALLMQEKEALLKQLKEIEGRLMNLLEASRKHETSPIQPTKQAVSSSIPIQSSLAQSERQSLSSDLKDNTSSNGNLEELISQATIDPRFKPYLLANKILLEIGGCMLLEAFGGRKLILTVGCTEVRGNTAKERLRQIRVAEYNADAELAKRLNPETSYQAQRSKTTSITHINGKETSEQHRISTSLTSTQAKAAIKGLEKVGTWKSPDGTLFFVAKGCFIDE